MRLLLPAVPFCLWALLPLAAQPAPASYQHRLVNFDSGYLDHAGAAATTVFRDTLTVRDAVWLRLHAADTNLPPGTRLKLTALQDGAVQWFDGESLRDYRSVSAFFNGNAVAVELIGGPRTRGNRVVVRAVDAGDPGMAPEPTSICGPTDDRQLSTDPRQGRQYPTGCTTWLISAACVLTAGHCASTTQQVHFNVPLSNSNGSLNFPPPSDQYPYDGSTLALLNNGVGQDWAVVTTVRNSNTRLYPGQKQGSWYDLGTVPSSPSGQNIRITGYGTRSNPPTWNQVQETHVGPLQTIGATSLCYVTDTTGGNSGSPVIHENTGKAIGIHTHGGCSSTGGCNSGTRIDRTDLQAAIAARIDRKKAGSWSTFGAGCQGTAGTPVLSATGFPDQGQTLTLQVANALAGQLGAMLIGASNTTTGSYALPLALAPYGAPGCSQLVSHEVIVPLATGGGSPSLPLVVPNNAALIGARFYPQYAHVDAGANQLGVVVSNGGIATIGD